jgi:hypothetical protein
MKERYGIGRTEEKIQKKIPTILWYKTYFHLFILTGMEREMVRTPTGLESKKEGSGGTCYNG